MSETPRDNLSIAQQKQYVTEIKTLARCYAGPVAPHPPAPQGGHVFIVTLCMGKAKDFGNIGRWFVKCEETHLGSDYPCKYFRFLTPPLPEQKLKALQQLWILHDSLGPPYSNEDSPSDHLIQSAFDSDDDLAIVSHSTPSPPNRHRPDCVTSVPTLENQAKHFPTPPSSAPRQPHVSQGSSGSKKRRSAPLPRSLAPAKRAKVEVIEIVDSDLDSDGDDTYELEI